MTNACARAEMMLRRRLAHALILPEDLYRQACRLARHNSTFAEACLAIAAAGLPLSILTAFVFTQLDYEIPCEILEWQALQEQQCVDTR